MEEAKKLLKEMSERMRKDGHRHLGICGYARMKGNRKSILDIMLEAAARDPEETKRLKERDGCEGMTDEEYVKFKLKQLRERYSSQKPEE